MASKPKNILLIVSFVIILLVCYHFGIAKTLKVRSDLKNLQQQEELFRNTPKQLSILKQKQHYYDSILGKYQLNKGSLQNNLLQTINLFAKEHSIKVASFLEPHISIRNDVQVKTYQFSLEGDFNFILALIHKLEQQTKFGEIINLNFEKKKNFKTGKDYLEASVLLKSFG